MVRRMGRRRATGDHKPAAPRRPTSRSRQRCDSRGGSARLDDARAQRTGQSRLTLRYSVTYTLPEHPPEKIAFRPLTVFYTEDKISMHHLTLNGLNQGYIVTIETVADALNK